jgi:MraZ protein
MPQEFFRGSSPVRVDEGGRVKLPAEFKRLVDKKCGPEAQFFVTSLDGKRALIYPIEEWLKKEAILAEKSGSNPDAMFYQSRTASWGQMAEMDKQGRLLIHPLLRNKAGLGADVLVQGMAGKVEPGFLQVVNLEQAMREMEEEQVTEERLARIGALGL